MAIFITRERPDTDEARALIDALDAYLASLYPPSSQYGLSVEALLAEEVAFFLVRSDGAVAGCGRVKCNEKEYREVTLGVVNLKNTNGRIISDASKTNRGITTLVRRWI